MSFWTDIRDTVESAAVVAGNYFLPGSGLVTSNLASSGSQDQLNSGLGRVAMLGSGVAGGVGGNLSNYGKVFDAAGNFVSGGENALGNLFSTGSAGAQSNTPEFKNLFDTYIANGAKPAEALQFTQDALSQGSGGATNWTKYLTNPSVLGSAISSGAGLLGAGLQANAARQAAQGIADANITSNQLMARMNEQNRARQEPFYQAGLSALPDYIAGIRGTEAQRAAGQSGDLVRSFSLKDFIADPGQEYRTRMGLDAIESSAVSRGLGQSGKTYQDLMRAGQEYAAQGFANRENAFYANQATRRGALGNLAGFSAPASSAIQAGDTAYGSNAANLASNTAVANAGAGATRGTSYGNALAGIGQNVYNMTNQDPLNALMAAYMRKQIG